MTDFKQVVTVSDWYAFLEDDSCHYVFCEEVSKCWNSRPVGIPGKKWWRKLGGFTMFLNTLESMYSSSGSDGEKKN